MKEKKCRGLLGIRNLVGVVLILIGEVGFGQNQEIKSVNDSSNTNFIFGLYGSTDYSSKFVSYYGYSPNTMINNLNYKTLSGNSSSGTYDANYGYDKRYETGEFGWNVGAKAFKKNSKHFAYSFGIFIDKQSIGTKTLDTLWGQEFFNSWGHGGPLPTTDSFTIENRYQLMFNNYFIAVPFSIEYLFLKKKKMSCYLSFETSLHFMFYSNVKAYDVISGENPSPINDPTGLQNYLNSPYLSSEVFNVYSAISINVMLPFKNFTLAFEPYFRCQIVSNYSLEYIDRNSYPANSIALGDVYFYQIGLSLVFYFGNNQGK